MVKNNIGYMQYCSIALYLDRWVWIILYKFISHTTAYTSYITHYTYTYKGPAIDFNAFSTSLLSYESGIDNFS